jgi:transposase
LLRHDIVYSGRTKWTIAHFNWLSDIAMPHPAQQIVFQEYIDAVTNCCNRVQRLTEQVRFQSRQGRQHKLIEALQSMRGISLIIAATITAELSDLTRFENPEKLMAFLGLMGGAGVGSR